MAIKTYAELTKVLDIKCEDINNSIANMTIMAMALKTVGLHDAGDLLIKELDSIRFAVRSIEASRVK